MLHQFRSPPWALALPISCLLHLAIGLGVALLFWEPLPPPSHQANAHPLLLRLQATEPSSPLPMKAGPASTPAPRIAKPSPRTQRWHEGVAYDRSDALDAPVLPVSAPDLSRLQHIYFTGQAIRLRLWIDTQGQVRRIDTLHASPDDAEALAVLRSMFLDTAYIPARRQGQPVAVWLDLELDFGLPRTVRTSDG